MAVGPAVEHRENSFDLARVMLAVAVLVGHAWPLIGRSGAPSIGGIAIHHLAVFGFFTLSGYLLTRSWLRSPLALPFMLRRCLRIFPALILVVLVAVFAIGPLFTVLPAAEYWGSGATWWYLWTVALFAQYTLPGVFEGFPRDAVNGSLWSLGPEFVCYLLLVVGGLLVALCSRPARSVGPGSGEDRGASARLGWLPPFALFCAAAAPALLPELRFVSMWLALPYLLIAFASRPSAPARGIARTGDPSYGVYLWAFPVQQMLFAVWPSAPFALNILIVLLISLALGYASWHLLEKRAIALGQGQKRGLGQHDDAVDRRKAS